LLAGLIARAEAFTMAAPDTRAGNGRIFSTVDHNFE
jgi:hypothetical protein